MRTLQSFLTLVALVMVVLEGLDMYEPVIRNVSLPLLVVNQLILLSYVVFDIWKAWREDHDEA